VAGIARDRGRRERAPLHGLSQIFVYGNNSALGFCKLVCELVQMLGFGLQFEAPFPDRRALHLQAAMLRLGPVLFDETIVCRVRLS
jgi:hypothetical protein